MFKIFVETVFENGEAPTREVGHICRSLDRVGPECLGLRIAKTQGTKQAAQRDADTMSISSPLTVFPDGGHSRCQPEFPRSYLDVVIGKIENPKASRRLGFVQPAVKFSAKLLQNDLMTQDLNGLSKVTVISDGEPALPNLVRHAVDGSGSHILDWWHISIRVRHIENAVKGLLQIQGFSGLLLLFERRSESLRWNL